MPGIGLLCFHSTTLWKESTFQGLQADPSQTPCSCVATAFMWLLFTRAKGRPGGELVVQKTTVTSICRTLCTVNSPRSCCTPFKLENPTWHTLSKKSHFGKRARHRNYDYAIEMWVLAAFLLTHIPAEDKTNVKRHFIYLLLWLNDAEPQLACRA